MAERVRANARRALGLAAIPAGVVAALVFGATWILAVAAAVSPKAGGPVAVAGALGLIAGILTAVAVRRLAVLAALAAVGSHPLHADRAPRLHNLLDGLCPTVGADKPSVHLVVHHGPNAMIVAGDAHRSSLVVTTGLLDDLERVELEAVLAHELAHLRSGEVLPATVAVIALAPMVMAGLIWRWVGQILPAPPQPDATWARPDGTRAARWLGLAGTGEREMEADLAAVRLTSYPPGLVAALTKVQAAGLRGPLGSSALASQLVAHLWLVPPGSSLTARLAALDEL